MIDLHYFQTCLAVLLLYCVRALQGIVQKPVKARRAKRVAPAEAESSYVASANSVATCPAPMGVSAFTEKVGTTAT